MSKWIKDFKEGDRLFQPLLVVQVSKGVTAANIPYLNLVLQDKTGTIDGKKWELSSEDDGVFEVGSFVLIEADVLNYRSNLQLKISEGKRVKESEINLQDFTISAPTPLPEMEKKLKEVILSIQDKDYNGLVKTLVQKHYASFVTFPAATRNHHEYANGLIFHTLSMVRTAEKLIECYPPLNRDLLIAGIVLHDLGKTLEFTSPVIPRYTVEGKLVGHISIIVSEIAEVAKALNMPKEKAILIQHLVLTHHGKPEFGSPMMPLVKEAILLNMIDDMDAKMYMVDKALEATEKGEFSARVFTLDDRSLYKPKN